MRDVKEENEVVLGQATTGVMSVHASSSRGLEEVRVMMYLSFLSLEKLRQASHPTQLRRAPAAFSSLNLFSESTPLSAVPI